MRSVRVAETAAGRDLFGVLLFGAVAAPAVAALRRWPLYSEHHAAVSVVVVVGLGAAMARLPAPGSAARRTVAELAVLSALVLAAAALFSEMVRSRSNAFYTPEALQGGMIVLLALYVGGCALRALAWRDARRSPPEHHARHGVPRDTGELEHSPPNEIRPVYLSPSATESLAGAPCADVPAIATADALTRGAAWLFILFWALVALEHRHAASVVLLAVGASMASSVFTLLPDVLVARR